MANPTTNFGWQMPTSTDLVTDLPADFEVFGQAVDTALVDLKGGTTGQVLSKASNTNMDFTWVTTDDANAIQNAIVDAKGDLIAASAADTPARLAVGANNTKLVAASGEATGLKYVGFQGASVWKSANQNLTSASQTTLTFDTEVFDTDGFHNNVTNNSRLTIPTGMSGKYLVTVKGDFSSNASGQRVVYHLVDGTLVNFASSAVNSASHGSYVSLSAVYQLTAGQYVEMALYQDSGSTLTTTGTAYYYTNMQITYLGA